jgi:hypothetical protein
MKTNIKDYIQLYSSKYFPLKKCKLIISSLDLSQEKTHEFYYLKEDNKKEVGEDPQTSILKPEKLGPIGNFIKNQWYKIIGEHILNRLNKKEKIDWYEGWNGYAFPKFIKYPPGTRMKKHWDHIQDLFEGTDQTRGIPTLSIITALNDNYSGGELILCEKYKYKLKAGETIVFPSTFLYPHEIKKITKGTRYSMVSWVW